jgi:hypothetical protein
VGVALDSTGKIYVANCGKCEGNTDGVTVYPAGSNGNVTPTVVITGASTGLNIPGGLALDSNRNIYVTNGTYTTARAASPYIARAATAMSRRSPLSPAATPACSPQRASP